MGGGGCLGAGGVRPTVAWGSCACPACWVPTPVVGLEVHGGGGSHLGNGHEGDLMVGMERLCEMPQGLLLVLSQPCRQCCGIGSCMLCVDCLACGPPFLSSPLTGLVRQVMVLPACPLDVARTRPPARPSTQPPTVCCCWVMCRPHRP